MVFYTEAYIHVLAVDTSGDDVFTRVRQTGVTVFFTAGHDAGTIRGFGINLRRSDRGFTGNGENNTGTDADADAHA